jgi:hypothetical protein
MGGGGLLKRDGEWRGGESSDPTGGGGKFYDHINALVFNVHHSGKVEHSSVGHRFDRNRHEAGGSQYLPRWEREGLSQASQEEVQLRFLLRAHADRGVGRRVAIGPTRVAPQEETEVLEEFCSSVTWSRGKPSPCMGYSSQPHGVVSSVMIRDLGLKGRCLRAAQSLACLKS